MVTAIVRAAASASLLAALAASAGAQGIYTCTDAKGRRLTADRPILDCIDREQLELNPSGLPRRRIGPTLTAAERAAEDEKSARLAEERSRALEDKRRERALVTRYPDRGSHDKERETALGTVANVKSAAQKRITELLAQRKLLEGEQEFYQFAPARTPPKIRHQLDEVDAQLVAQKRFLAEQDAEKARLNARFDEELARLKLLWAQQGGMPTAAGRAASGTAVKPVAAAPAVR